MYKFKFSTKNHYLLTFPPLTQWWFQIFIVSLLQIILFIRQFSQLNDKISKRVKLDQLYASMFYLFEENNNINLVVSFEQQFFKCPLTNVYTGNCIREIVHFWNLPFIQKWIYVFTSCSSLVNWTILYASLFFVCFSNF